MRRRQLEHGGAFVDFVEHRAVHHRGASLQCALDLMPVEPSPATRNRIEGRRGVHVVPREAGKNDGHVFEAEPLCFSQIRFDFLAIEPIDALLVPEASDRPGAEDRHDCCCPHLPPHDRQERGSASNPPMVLTPICLKNGSSMPMTLTGSSSKGKPPPRARHSAARAVAAVASEA